MKYIIDKNSNNLSIKSYLISRLNLSSRLIRHLKKYYDGILLNGVHSDVNGILKENDVLELDFSDRDDDVNEHLVKTDIPLEILYEDKHIVVAIKPIGILSQADSGGKESTAERRSHYTTSNL